MGAGRSSPDHDEPWGPHTWLNAGVRVVGDRAVVENSRKKLVANVPLSATAVDVVTAMSPLEFHRWRVTDGVGLLAYCDWLIEQGEHRWAARVRRWADVAVQDVYRSA